jgi:hypothetical protein
MNENTPKSPDVSNKTTLTKDYGEFGKCEVIDISEELTNYDVLAPSMFSSRH